MTIIVDQNRTETIGGNETITIDKDRTETVQGNETITVDKNRTEMVQGDETITVGRNPRPDDSQGWNEKADRRGQADPDGGGGGGDHRRRGAHDFGRLPRSRSAWATTS